MPTIIIGVNDGHFTLIRVTSSYVNPEWVYSAGLWEKCYCLMPQVAIGVANDTNTMSPFGGGGGIYEFFFCQCCASQRCNVMSHVVLAHCDLCWAQYY